MPSKPPAFQFYAKDWRSSMTVQSMTHEQRGIYIDMLAIAWDSEEPGTINLSEDALCRELGIFKRTLQRLLADFPTTWRREEGKLVQPKLKEQWIKYKEISTKRSASAVQMHMQKGGSASASASAKSTTTPPTPPSNGGTKFLVWARETIEVQMGRHQRLPDLRWATGAQADVVVEALTRKGFPARLVPK